MSYIVRLFVTEIKAGNITIDDVPAKLRQEVEAALVEDKQPQDTEDGDAQEG